MADIEEHVDQLYALPLEEFTSARNALAKESKRPTIKDLEKPNIAAWAVNQLYWKERPLYDRLIKAAERLRSEHRKMLSGKSSDIRDVEKSHREVLREAVDRIRGILKDGGHAATDATMTAVHETLEALPSGDVPGRLVRPLKPLGFEALSGVAIKPALRIVPPKAGKATEASKPDPKVAKEDTKAVAAALAEKERERKRRKQQAEKEMKVAEAAMLRAEDAVKQAEKSLADLRAARDQAVSEYQRARLRAHQ